MKKVKKEVKKTKEESNVGVASSGIVADSVASTRDILKAPSTTGQVLSTVKIAPFSGEFGRQDINSLRDKVNEIIDFINK